LKGNNLAIDPGIPRKLAQHWWKELTRMVQPEPLVVLHDAAHDRAAEEVGADRMFEARMVGASVDEVRESKLPQT